MASVNEVTLLGNVGTDPELKYLPSGDAIVSLSIATKDTWKDKATGEKKEQTEWHRVTFFGKLAEIVGQYVNKGSLLYVKGSLRTRKYTDKDNIERYVTEIRADSMQMCGGNNGGGGGQQQAPAQRQAAPARQASAAPARQAPAQRPAPNFSDMDDDIPF